MFITGGGINRTTIVKAAYYPMLLLTGIGLSIGKQIGVAGIGLNELFLLLSLLCFIFVLPRGVGVYRNFFFTHPLVVLAATCLVAFYSIGYFTGLIYEPDKRALYQFIRLFIFAFAALGLPYTAFINSISNPQKDLMLMTLGVAVSSVYNWVFYLFGSYMDPELPGQNMIGQNVALFFPFLIFLLGMEKHFTKRLLLILLISLFLVTSLYSGSKGSWLAISGGSLITLFFSGRRGLYLAVFSAVLTVVIFSTFHHEITNIVNNELTASAGSNSNSQRFAAIFSGFYIALEHPFGVGTAYQHFAAIYMRETGLHWIMPDPHNTWAHIVSQAGFFGLLSFLVINASAGVALLSNKLINGLFKASLIAIFIIAMFLMQLTGEFVTQAFWWLLLGVFFAAASNNMSVLGRNGQKCP